MKYLFISLLVMVSILSCSQVSKPLSLHVTEKWGDKLKEVDVDYFILSLSVGGKLGISDRKFEIYNGAQVKLEGYGRKEYDYVAGIEGELSTAGWIVSVPRSAKQLHRKEVASIIDKSLEILIEKKKQDQKRLRDEEVVYESWKD